MWWEKSALIILGMVGMRMEYAAWDLASIGQIF